MRFSKFILGLTTLALGVVALGFAAIPRALFDVPPPWPAIKEAEPKETMEGGKTFEWKGLKVTVGGKRTIEPLVPTSPPTTSKVFSVMTAIFALAGATIGCIACWREQSYGLALPGMGFCCLALFWHYVVLGFTVATIIVILLVVIVAISGV